MDRGAIHHRSSPEAKIALFRSLFRGRDDVYPCRFTSRKSGKSGYSPVCGNEWLRGICEKPRVKCAACPHQRFLPVTDQVICWHLSGRDDRGADFVAGAYAMLLDETCFFLAMDCDKTGWQEDTLAVLATCARINVPAALERSRSGNGGHVWMFFEEPVPAALARELGSHILTETMEHRPEIGLDSYDRFFPNQDTLPQGGFGNLIALPLQKEPREIGNSVFVDEQFAPHADQWAFLSSVKRMTRTAAEEILHRARQRGRVVGVRIAPTEEEDCQPWQALPSRRQTEASIVGPLPKRIELTLSDGIYIEKVGLPPGLRNRLLRIAAFQNPEFYKAQAMRLPTYGKPRIIGCAEDHARHLALPRGCLDELRVVLSELHVEVDINDERFKGVPDKRLLILEGEFASVLQVCAREKNTLSAIIRQAWDTGDLRSLVKNSPARATGAHISIVGHITRQELRQLITATDLANGLANRFLWLCVRRSKALPEGGSLRDETLRPLASRLNEAVAFAHTVGELRRDAEARAIWHEVYRQLSAGKPGLLGAATSRAESQVMRLAMLYALLDRSMVICSHHLLGGLAVWTYAEQSARYIFGSALGDPVADEILAHLRSSPEGLTRTEIRNLFSNHQSKARIDESLKLLRDCGLARREPVPTGGRPEERWFACE